MVATQHTKEMCAKNCYLLTSNHYFMSNFQLHSQFTKQNRIEETKVIRLRRGDFKAHAHVTRPSALTHRRLSEHVSN